MEKRTEKQTEKSVEKRFEKFEEQSSEKRSAASALAAKPCVNSQSISHESMNTRHESAKTEGSAELVSMISPATPSKVGSLQIQTSTTRSRYIPSTVRHAVYMRDKGICQNCGSTRAMQVEHIKPYAVGGEHSLENLRLLCRSCNQRTAIEAYGLRQMTKFLKSPAVMYF